MGSTPSDEAKADELLGHFVRLEKLGLVVDRVELPRAYAEALKRTGSLRKGKLWGAPVRLGKRVSVVAGDPVLIFSNPRPLVATLVAAGGKVVVKKTRMKQLWVPA